MHCAEALTIVLGADGFLGKHLVATWRNRGWPVFPVGRDAGDFTDPTVVDDVLRNAPPAGRILHTVTKQRTGDIQYAVQGELLYDNTRIHLNILEGWRRHQPGAKLISLGSSCIYPESGRPIPEAAFRTGQPHPSVTGYALVKEVLVTGSTTYGFQYGLHWLHCVLATVYGPSAPIRSPRSHFMAAMIARAATARQYGGADQFQVWGSPDTVRDLLYVTDQIDAVIAADAAFEDTVVNCASNVPVTIGTCARVILDALDWDAEIVRAPDTYHGVEFKSLDSSRFLAATGWQPQIPLAIGVRRVLAADFAGVVP